jgi:hypothetical protein
MLHNASIDKARLAALLGYVQACEQRLLADLPPAERSAPGSAQRWSAHALLAHNTDFRREQVVRLRAAAAGVEPPAFPQVDHTDPEAYRLCSERPWPVVRAEAATVVADMVVALDALDDALLVDPSRLPWLGGRQLWAQVLVRGAWHPLGHVADHLVAGGRSAEAVAVLEGVVRAARALAIPDTPGGVSLAVYTLAAVHAVAAALELLRSAVAGDPSLAGRAAGEPDFASLRTDPEFPVPAAV